MRARTVGLVFEAEGQKSATSGTGEAGGMKLVCLVYLVQLTTQAKETKQTIKS